MSGKGRLWRAGTGLVLGVVAPALIVTACTADEQNSDTTRSGTAAATSSSVSKTTPRTGTAAPGQAGGDSGGGSGSGAEQTGGGQPGAPGGTDTCGATFCGTTENPAPAPGGTDTCGATFCGTTDQQPAPAALWDPCGISDADISAQGFRADSKTALSGSDGVKDKNCRWQSATGKLELTVVSTRMTLYGFQEVGKYVDFSTLTVGGRAAHQFRASQDSNKIGCYVGFEVSGGFVAFVTRNLQPDAPEEPCAAARRISGALVGYVP
ncbi:DUF3558 family protein [Nocardia arizonensis]|uniref:DUF3558 family protein n=1 Tax=Nocardia arizonensis TaxID=1141647 RepID=UPI00138EF68B|nr:DUF3558 family protein [Nocardia arizonensis]